MESFWNIPEHKNSFARCFPNVETEIQKEESRCPGHIRTSRSGLTLNMSLLSLPSPTHPSSCWSLHHLSSPVSDTSKHIRRLVLTTTGVANSNASRAQACDTAPCPGPWAVTAPLIQLQPGGNCQSEMPQLISQEGCESHIFRSLRGLNAGIRSTQTLFRPNKIMCTRHACWPMLCSL